MLEIGRKAHQFVILGRRDGGDAYPQRGASRNLNAPQPSNPSLLITACVNRSHRRPAKGKASSSTGPISSSSALRTSVRARCSLVFTVYGLMPSRSAVSSMLRPSMTRATKTVR